jgi:RNA polymerase sigma-54 factor
LQEAEQMELTLTPQLLPQQSLGVSPMLIASAQLLSLGGVELAETIRRELEENPALVPAERLTCHTCGATRRTGLECRRCGPGEPRREPSGAVELTAALPAQVSDAARLLTELRLALPASEHTIAETVIASLDERGYLTAAPRAIAEWLKVDAARVEHVLAELQSTGPAGLGARDLRECLLLQLQRLDGDHALARATVEGHLQALAAGRYGGVARALGVKREEIVRVRDFIRETLRPSPGFEAAHDARARHPPPDAIVEDRPDGLRVRLTEPERFAIHVCPLYARLAEQGTAHERRHAARHTKGAQEFTTRLQQRWDTMLRVVEYAVQHQSEWVRRGSGARRSLTRARVAHELSLHESTVSRAVRERSMQLPGGRMVAISDLFARGDDRREALRQLLAAEPRALTDAELTDALAARGHVLARRTVAKYRAQLGQARHSLR